MISFGNIEVKKDVPLAPYTSYKIGGPAEYFYEARNLEDLVKIIKEATRKKVPFLILGQGTNILISDKGLKGLVVINRCQKFNVKGDIIFSESGVLLTQLVRELAEKNLGGLEFLANIPGTVGGAIVGNAGSYGKSISDILTSAKILLPDGKIDKFERDFFEFDYRNSKLKKGNFGVILSTEIKVDKKPKEKIVEEIEKGQKLRQSKHPQEFSCGSFFKNIDIKLLPMEEIKKFEEFLIEGKIPAGRLIESCGLKGTQIGGAKVSEKHANFIVNLGQARCSDVLRLADIVKRKVLGKFGIELKEEVKVLGNF